MLVLNGERVKVVETYPYCGQALLAEGNMTTRVPHRRNAEDEPFTRPTFRAGVTLRPGAFGQGLAHAQQSHDVS